MDRRAFLKTTCAAAAASTLPWREALASTGDWRTYEVATTVEVLKPHGVSHAWVPLPMSDDTDWQKGIGNGWTGNAAQARIVSDGKYGVSMVYAQWGEGEAAPQIEITSRVMTRDRAVDRARPHENAASLSRADREFYTAATELIPTDGIVRTTALEITKGARTDIQKGRAIYEWVVENTFRNPKTRGCGWGDIKSMLEAKNLGGKCGDLNAMYVGLARAVGVPARDVYGIRVAPSAFGYRSLGVGSPSVTRAQHCRAEFFAQGFGWIPVDPADVRKVALEEPPGNLPLHHAKVVAMRKKLFGAWEMNWLAYNMGHDVKLPGSSGPKLPYLMYINAETGGEMRDQLEPDALRYAITARELSA